MTQGMKISLCMYIDSIAEEVEHLRRWIEEYGMYANIGILVIQLRCYGLMWYMYSVCYLIQLQRKLNTWEAD